MTSLFHDNQKSYTFYLPVTKRIQDINKSMKTVIFTLLQSVNSVLGAQQRHCYIRAVRVKKSSTNFIKLGHCDLIYRFYGHFNSSSRSNFSCD